MPVGFGTGGGREPRLPTMMRELVDRYLNQTLSRRGFINAMMKGGFSAAAATSILDSLTPIAYAESPSDLAGRGSSAAKVLEGTGAELLVAQLKAAGVRFVFNCGSSGTFAIFDALLDHPGMQVIQVPQEGQMVAMAHGYALASGQCAFTVNGDVGFPNTLNNLYNAWKDRVPIVVAAQSETAREGRHPATGKWDDYLSPSANFTRWRWSVERAEDVADIARRAFKVASTPPQGPVSLAFPYDVLATKGVRAAIVDQDRLGPRPGVHPTADRVEAAAKLLLEAKRPLLVVGSEVTRSSGKAEVIRLAERLALPVVQGDRLFDDFPTNHDLFLGDYVRQHEEADMLLAIGTELPVHKGVVSPNTKVVQVGIDSDAVGRTGPGALAIIADAKEAAADLLAAVGAMASNARLRQLHDSRYETIREQTQKRQKERRAAAHARWNNMPLSCERVAGELNQRLERDAIIVPELAVESWLGSSENTALSQFTFAPDAKSKIGRTTGLALGWGIGAAMGVKLAQPERQVVALQGDGGFMFAQAESLWTMARYEIPIIVVIFNNRSYNGPRNKILLQDGRQAKAGREMTCYLGDPDVDFAKVASGFGVAGEVVRSPSEVVAAIERAITSTRDGKPYLVDAVVGRTGLGADSTWYPKYSVAAARSRKV